MKVLVVPTIRENSIKEFLNSWDLSQWDSIIVVEDNPEKKFVIPDVDHYSWTEIDQILGMDNWIISRRDSAIRSFGFLMAYRLGADWIFTLDDDCYPSENDFVNCHIENMQDKSRWMSSCSEFRTRGMPYRNLGNLNNVVLNMGMWNNHPDLDSVQSLTSPITNFKAPQGNQVMPCGVYFPICGMNFAFKREIAVLSYFAPMGENSPYHRFDDIWFGIILKKICDHLRLLISYGEPHVDHQKASNPFENLKKEAPGIQANEDFWEKIDGISLKGSTPKACLLEVANGLQGETSSYLTRYGQALEIWATYFE